MREEEKPFVCYKSGRWSFQITPRNGEGWRALGAWVALIFLLTGGYVGLVAREPENDAVVGWLTAGYVVVLGLWAVVMTRWMLRRSEMIDTNELLRIKREHDRQRQRRN